MPVQEERPSTCQHAHQRLNRCLPQRKSRQCSGLTRRQLPDGQRLESSRRSGRSAATAGTGRPKFAPFWRVSRSSARNEAWPLSGTTPERLGRRAAQPAGGHLPKQLGGVDPGGQHTASGGALRVRCDDSIGQRKPGSIRPPRASCEEPQQDHQNLLPQVTGCSEQLRPIGIGHHGLATVVERKQLLTSCSHALTFRNWLCERPTTAILREPAAASPAPGGRTDVARRCDQQAVRPVGAQRLRGMRLAAGVRSALGGGTHSA